MLGTVRVGEDLFDGLGSEKSVDHRISSSRVEGIWRNAINGLLSHIVPSIAGLLRRKAE
jgi:hypothetical protein